MEKSQTIADADKLYASLKDLPTSLANPVLVIVSGLPGAGKTYFAKKLSEKLQLTTLESDFLRRVLNPSPVYTRAESLCLFNAIHLLCERLLKEGYSVIIDATNLAEKNRQSYYDISDRLEIKMIIVQITAPESIIKERLNSRAGELNNNSDADWEIYLRMSKSVDKINRKHYALDTSADYSDVFEKIVEEIKKKEGIVPKGE